MRSPVPTAMGLRGGHLQAGLRQRRNRHTRLVAAVHESTHFAKRRSDAHEVEPRTRPGERESGEDHVGEQFAPHVQGYSPAPRAFDANARTGALKGFAQKVAKPQAAQIDIVVLDDIRDIPDSLSGGEAAADELAVLAAREVMPVRAEFGLEESNALEHLAAQP